MGRKPQLDPSAAGARLRERLAEEDVRPEQATDFDAWCSHCATHVSIDKSGATVLDEAGEPIGAGCPAPVRGVIPASCAIAHALLIVHEHEANARGPLRSLAEEAGSIAAQLRTGNRRFLAQYARLVKPLHAGAQRVVRHRHAELCVAPIEAMRAMARLADRLDALATDLPRPLKPDSLAHPATKKKGRPAERLARELIAALREGGLTMDAIGALLYGDVSPKKYGREDGERQPARWTQAGQRVHDLQRREPGRPRRTARGHK